MKKEKKKKEQTKQNKIQDDPGALIVKLNLKKKIKIQQIEKSLSSLTHWYYRYTLTYLKLK